MLSLVLAAALALGCPHDASLGRIGFARGTTDGHHDWQLSWHA